MKFVQLKYNSDGSYPELALFPDEDHARDAFKLATNKNVSWLYWVLHVASLTAILAISYTKVMQSFSGIIAVLILMGVLGTSSTALICLYNVLYYKRIQRALRQQLNELAIPICIKCGYQLRGLSGARCPECGTTFVVQNTNHSNSL